MGDFWDERTTGQKVFIVGVILLAVFGFASAIFDHEPTLSRTPTYRERQEEKKAKENREWREKVCKDFGCN